MKRSLSRRADGPGLRSTARGRTISLSLRATERVTRGGTQVESPTPGVRRVTTVEVDDGGGPDDSKCRGPHDRYTISKDLDVGVPRDLDTFLPQAEEPNISRVERP